MVDTLVARVVERSDGQAAATRLIGQAHRALSALAAISVLIMLTVPWQTADRHSPAAGLLAGVGYLAVAVLLVLTGVAGSRPGRRFLTLASVDLATLVLAVVAQVLRVKGLVSGRAAYFPDETLLVHGASRALAHGNDPYLGHWVLHAPNGVTVLFDGRAVDTFGYPPLSAMVGASLARIAPGAPEAMLTGILALLTTAVIVFVSLPVWLRPLTVLAVLAIGPLPYLAAHGYPVLPAMPFVLLVLRRWPLIGAGGRLGRAGVVSGVLLGLACTAQQLVWFVVPFLLVGLWRVRRGELDARAAVTVVLRYAGVVAVTFAVIDLPFVIWSPSAWWNGLLDPITQSALFDGPGAGNISLRLVGGSGALQFYGYAALLVLAMLLVLLALFPARLGSVLVALPWMAFWFSLRSQPVYYVTFAAATVFALITVDPAWLRGARPLGRPRRCLVVPGLCAVAALGCLVVAAATPAPLRLRITDVVARSGRVTALDVAVTNRTDHVVRPSFVNGVGAALSQTWTVEKGPAALQPGRRARYVLSPPRLQPAPAARTIRLYAVSDDPESISSATGP